MQKDLIIISEYCTHTQIDPQFINLLCDDGLIEIQYEGSERYIPLSQLSELERYARLYYDLSLNVAGLDVVRQSLAHIQALERQVAELKNELKFSKG